MFKLTRFVSKLSLAQANNVHKQVATVSSNAFKSDLSLDKLYPNSKAKIFTPLPPSSNTQAFSGYVPLDQLQIRYDRSSGPGGQNVNKLETKVDMRFNVKSANWFSDAVKERLCEDFKTKINKEGFLIIKSDVTRYQQMNLADALEKLRNMIRDAEKPKTIELSPEKLEKIRRKQEKAARERLLIKRQKSETKSARQAPNVEM
ncbi:unnamed protein product [Diamesa hyperborea]